MTWTRPTFSVYDNPDDPEQVAQLNYALTILQGGPLVIDVETTYDRNAGFSTPTDLELLAIGLAVDPNHVTIIGHQMLQRPDLWGQKLAKTLHKSNLIGHNGKYDMLALRRFGVFDLWFDTMLAHYCLNEQGPHSLGKIAEERLGAPEWKHLSEKYSRWMDIPKETLYQYNAYDVTNTYRLFLQLHEELEKEYLLGLHDFLVRSSNTLTDIEHDGLRVSKPKISGLQAGFEKELLKLRNDLNMTVGKKFNPNSVNAVKLHFKYRFGIQLPSTRASMLEAFLDKSFDAEVRLFCSQLLEYRKVHKLQTTYVQGLTKWLSGDFVYSSFLLHGTVTGRLSSKSPNLQNIPRNSDIKSVFVPHRRGNWLVQCDYRQAELRALAWLAQDAYLREVLNNESRDIHSEVASWLFGEDFTEEDRHSAKTVVYGVTYGMTASELANRLQIDRWKAEVYIDKWFAMIPRVRKWITQLESQVLRTGVVQSPFGHKRRFGKGLGKEREAVMKKARAFLPQNMVSNICLEAANRLRGQVDMRILVHDAIIFETEQNALSTIDKVCDTMQATGREYLRGFVSMPVDVLAGPNWGELKEIPK